MKNNITIKDVAREAGVSVATVSYVINERNDKRISDKTRKKVKKRQENWKNSKRHEKQTCKK